MPGAPVKAGPRRSIQRLRELPGRRAAERSALIADLDLFFPEARVDNYSGHRDRVRVGAHSAIRGRLLTFAHGGRITIGEWCYVGHRTEIWSAESVDIGDRVLISHDVNIIDSTNHSRDPAERHAHYRHILTSGLPDRAEDIPGVVGAPIVIEDDVWISFGVTILRGIRVGARSIIAAGSIVTEDVPANSVYRMQVTPEIRPLEP